MSTVELDHDQLVEPTEPWTLISTNLTTGESTPGAPPFEIVGLRILPPEAFAFLSPQKPTDTEQKTAEPKKEGSHV